MNTPAITWVDMTDLMLWTGHFTGIQRVVYNIAVFYAKEPATKFFVYDSKAQDFYEIDFATIAPPLERPADISWRRQLREESTSQIRNYYTRMPDSWRKVITPRIKPLAGRAYHGTHHMIHITKSAFVRTKQGPQQKAHFRANDSVIIVGAGWVRPTILDELWRRKQRAGFKVYHFIHDVIPVKYPHLFGPGHFELFTEYLFEVAHVSDGLITNSIASKNDTIEYFKNLLLPEPPIGVIRLGDELELKGEPIIPMQRFKSGEYILAVGTIEIRKNHALLYATYKLAQAKNIKLPPLVIVGRPGWNAGDTVFAMTHDPEMEGLIYILKNTHDAELDWLYRNCMMTIYPSMYEGWGLPIAESLVYSKMALSASTSSMPEIAGDLLEYFQPFDASDCLRAITMCLKPGYIGEAEARIKQQYKVQTWQATYDEFRAVIAKQEQPQ